MKLFLQSSLLVLLLFLEATIAMGQNTAQLQQQFFKAYTSNSNTACKMVLQGIAEKKDFENRLFLAKGYNASAGLALGNQDEDLASELLDKAVVLTKELLKENNESAEAHALLSASYGMKIGLSPMKGMLLGGKSSSAAKKGVQLAPENPFTNYVLGNYLYYTPAMFGGDIEESVKYLEKAKTLYQEKAMTKNWDYLATMVLLGQAHHSQKNYDKAIAVYKAALEVAPAYGYIKKYLLPRSEKAKS